NFVRPRARATDHVAPVCREIPPRDRAVLGHPDELIRSGPADVRDPCPRRPGRDVRIDVAHGIAEHEPQGLVVTPTFVRGGEEHRGAQRMAVDQLAPSLLLEGCEAYLACAIALGHYLAECDRADDTRA